MPSPSALPPLAGQPTATTDDPTKHRAMEKTDAAKAKEEYESQFASRPISPQATSYALFSNPNRFSTNYIHGSTHYLTTKLEGRLWLDVNGDGKRGDYINSTVQAMENDHGIGGVHVHLVHCESNEPVSSRVTRSIGPEGGSAQGAGSYSFDLHAMQSGRYYFMYEAPLNYRISGNVLPLERDSQNNCLPKGGEGDIYIKEAREKGDLDFRGYCARSIGCFEVNNINPHKKSNFDDFSDLVVLENDVISPGEGVDYFKHDGNLAALPSADYMNVGLAQEIWDLPAYQYADAQVTLTFSADVDPIDLYRAVPDEFERSEVRAQLEDSLAKFLVGSGREGSAFSVTGVNILRGEVSVHQAPEVHEKESMLPQDVFDTGMLRGIPGSTRRRMQAATGRTSKELTYTITARGSYRPPPHEELGPLVQDSINDDPQGLLKSLKDREELPGVFDKADDVYARVLSVKEEEIPPPVVKVKVKVVNAEVIETWQGSYFGWMDSWAVFPVIILAGLIALLMAMFIFRRAFVRRAKKGKQERNRHLMGIQAVEGSNECTVMETDLRRSSIKKRRRQTLEMSMTSAKAREKKLFRRSIVDKERKVRRRSTLDMSMTSAKAREKKLFRRSIVDKERKVHRRSTLGMSMTSAKAREKKLFRRSIVDKERKVHRRSTFDEGNKRSFLRRSLFRRASLDEGNRKSINKKDEHLEIDPNSMSVSQIRQELESYFVSSDTFVEKREMAEALSQAREGGLRSSAGTAATDSSPPPLSPTHGQEMPNSFSASVPWSFSPNQSFTTNEFPSFDDRPEQTRRIEASYAKLKVRELKQMLEASGLSSSGFFDKSDMVHALAVARVDEMVQEQEPTRGHRSAKSRRATFDSSAPRRQFTDPFQTTEGEKCHTTPPNVHHSFQAAPRRNVRHSFQTAPQPNVRNSFQTAAHPNDGTFQTEPHHDSRQSFQTATRHSTRHSFHAAPRHNARQSFHAAPPHDAQPYETVPPHNAHGQFQAAPPENPDHSFHTAAAWY